jgi:hypothetical protein
MTRFIGRQADCARALDSLNALDSLEELGQRRFSPRLSSPARAYDGDQPSPWVSVVFWTRPPGYLGYRMLSVYGIWASIVDDGGIHIAVGMKKLPFARPFFDPEPYHKLFRRDYTLYYDDDGSPPAQPICAMRYAPDQRLIQRETVRASLMKMFASS